MAFACPGGRGGHRRWPRSLQLEKRLEGGQRLEEGASPGLFGTNNVESRDPRTTGHTMNSFKFKASHFFRTDEN